MSLVLPLFTAILDFLHQPADFADFDPTTHGDLGTIIADIVIPDDDK